MLATKADQRPHYKRVVAHIPTHWLMRELARREAGQVVALRRVTPVPVIRLPGLYIDRARLSVEWRGARTTMTQTEMAVLVALARRHPHPTTGMDLGAMGWPDFEPEDGDIRARVYVHYLRRKLPGLVASEKNVGYWLDLGAAS